jgi:raffinose/stachyose/melibiose transport system permease protein
MLRNIIGTCAILAGTNMLQKLDIIMITTNGGPGNKTLNLPMYIYQTALKDNRFGYANTQGVVLIGIGLLTVVIISRMFKIGNVFS